MPAAAHTTEAENLQVHAPLTSPLTSVDRVLSLAKPAPRDTHLCWGDGSTRACDVDDMEHAAGLVTAAHATHHGDCAAGACALLVQAGSGQAGASLGHLDVGPHQNRGSFRELQLEALPALVWGLHGCGGRRVSMRVCWLGSSRWL